MIRIDLSGSHSIETSERRGADITIVVNVPLNKVEGVSTGPPTNGEGKQEEAEAKEMFRKAVEDYKIQDYGLFA